MKRRDTPTRPNPKALLVSVLIFVVVPVMLALILR